MTSFIKSTLPFAIWILISNIYQINVVADQPSNNIPENAQRVIQHASPLEQMSKYLKSKKSWQSLQGSWGKRAGVGYPLDEYSDDVFSNRYMDDDVVDGDFQDADVVGFVDDGDNGRQEYYPDKRAWKSMNAGWGKRIGAWKREPGWNNLKGLWGKRSTNWNKLSSAWGKRSK